MNVIGWIVHFCAALVAFGTGFFMADSLFNIWHNGFRVEKVFLFIFSLAVLFIGAHDVTYKHCKHSLSRRKIRLVIIVIWVLMPLLGILFWALTK